MEDMFTKMGKTELRAACKAAGIPYGKLSNDGMRDALRAKASPEPFEASEAELNAQQGRKEAKEAKEATTPTADAPPAPAKAPSAKKTSGSKKQPGDRHTGNGLKIEKEREERNGIKRPSQGGKCREVWDYLDDVYAGDDSGTEGSKGVMPTAQMVKDASAQMGWNANNASIEFYQWRKFMGITGRQTAAKK